MSIYYLIISNTCVLCNDIRKFLNEKNFKIKLIDINKIIDNNTFIKMFEDKNNDYILFLPVLYKKNEYGIQRIEIQNLINSYK